LLNGEHKDVDRIAEFKQLKMRLKGETGARSDCLCLLRRQWCPMFPIESVDIRPLEPRDVRRETMPAACQFRVRLQKAWQFRS
jgi:hypothetical protein